ncbi:hypothetical protein [Azospirillum palustre]
MSTSFSRECLNLYLAPGIADFTEFDAPDISGQYPQSTHWIANHFLNSILRGSYSGKFEQYAINHLYRAQAAFSDYHEARALTREFIEAGKPSAPHVRVYFRALSRWESCLLNTQIFIDILNKINLEFDGEKVFYEGDNSKEARAYSIANKIKHYGGEIRNGSCTETETVPMWLTNSGISTTNHEISYEELSIIVSSIVSLADEIQDPISFREQNHT